MKPNSIGIIKSVHVALIAAGLLALPLTARAVEQTVAPKAVTQAAPSQAVAIKKATKAAPAPQKAALAPEPALVVASAMSVTLGKSTLLRIPAPVARMSVGNPAVADVVLITPREIYILGKTIGSTNVILWTHGGQTAVIDVGVGMDTAALQGKIEQLMPGEKGIMVNAAADSLVLSGAVADAVKVDRAMALAGAYSGKKVINLLRVTDAQQVMLEVKVAEVSKTLVDKLGAKFNMSRTNGSWTYSILSDFLSGMLPGTTTRGGPGSISAFKDPTKMLQLDAEFKDGLFKILAEPNIMAISGQEGSFLAGGKIFIPVAQSSATGGSTITLEEREFGVGLRFTPTVLEDGRINLRVTPEVSELSGTGTEVMAGSGARSVLPSISTRRASTTVQLKDGQSFAIGGLIKSNVTETMNRFPLLGEIPILGMLFRSSEFQNERTELLFVITPRLVKPLPPDYALPTDAFVPPDRSEFFVEGKLEGTPGGLPEPKAEPGAAGGGFQMK